MKSAKPEPFLSLGFAGIDWFEHYLVHGPGDVQGQPVELDDEFAAFVVKAYQVDAAGARKVRRAFLSRSKGRSKSGLAAMIACFEALGPCRFSHFAEPGEISSWGYEYEPGEPVGAPLIYVEVLNVATEEGQAGNTYDAIYYMLNPDTCSKELLRDYGKVDVGLTRTTLPNSRGFIEPITSADSSKDGGKSTFIVADETHLWILPRLQRLHGIMTRNLLKRKIASGWMLETSTMYGEGENSVAEGTHAYAKLVVEGKNKDRTLLFDHKQAADTWDLNKRSDRMRALREAYGPAAEWMNLDAICDSWDDPQVSEAEFRRYWLNQPVPTLVQITVFGAGKWETLADADPTHAPATITAFAIEVDIDRAWASIAAAGTRADGRTGVELVERESGTSWLIQRCLDLHSKNGGARFVVDDGGPAGALISSLETARLDVVTCGTGDVAEACATMVDAVNDGTIAHWPNPILQSAVTGAVKKAFRDGGFTFRRLASDVDVTPLLAVTLARWAAVTKPAPPEVWSIREMVEQLKAEQAETEAETGQPPTKPGVIQRADGSIFTPI